MDLRRQRYLPSTIPERARFIHTAFLGYKPRLHRWNSYNAELRQRLPLDYPPLFAKQYEWRTFHSYLTPAVIPAVYDRLALLLERVAPFVKTLRIHGDLPGPTYAFMFYGRIGAFSNLTTIILRDRASDDCWEIGRFIGRRLRTIRLHANSEHSNEDILFITIPKMNRQHAANSIRILKISSYWTWKCHICCIRSV